MNSTSQAEQFPTIVTPESLALSNKALGKPLLPLSEKAALHSSILCTISALSARSLFSWSLWNAVLRCFSYIFLARKFTVQAWHLNFPLGLVPILGSSGFSAAAELAGFTEAAEANSNFKGFWAGTSSFFWHLLSSCGRQMFRFLAFLDLGSFYLTASFVSSSSANLKTGSAFSAIICESILTGDFIKT